APRPSPRALGRTCIADRSPPGSRIFTSSPRLGIDRRRHEVVALRRRLASRFDVASSGDLVVVDPADRSVLRRLLVVFWRDRYEPIHEGGVVIGVVPPARRPAFEPVRLRPERLSASQGHSMLPAVV